MMSALLGTKLCHSEARSAEEPAVACSIDAFARHYHAHLLLDRTLQNELTPNQANISVKQIATATRPKPTFPA